MLKTLRIAFIATMTFACVGLAACGNAGTGNSVSVENRPTKTTVVTTTTEDEDKTEATTTTTTKATTTKTDTTIGTTTTKTTTAGTTTVGTTTAGTTTSDTTTIGATTATTTTEVTDTSEPETTTSEAPEETEVSVQTSKIDLTATMPVETEEPKDSNMMTVEDCIKKIVKENLGEEVVSIELDEDKTLFTITTNNGTTVGMIADWILDEYYSGKLVDYSMFSYYCNDEGPDAILY